MSRIVVGLAILILIGIAGVIGLSVWDTYTHLDVQISPFGWAAMAAGTALTLLLAGGLMWLVFYSARKGYDDRPPRDFPPSGDG